MSKIWPQVKLGGVLILDLDSVRVDPSKMYEMVGVYSFGRGLFNREPVNGSNTSYKFFYRLKPDHIVMSQLFGWEGALAVSSPEFAGRYVSPQFPTFLCDPARVERVFLGWFMRRPAFWEHLGGRTKGMGDRRRTLNPEALFDCEVPLPPLDEQRRIIAKIEHLSAKIDEARRMRSSSGKEIDVLFSKMLTGAFLPYFDRTVPIGSVFKVTTGGTPSRGNPAYWGGNIKWVSSGEVAFSRIRDTSEKITTEGQANSNTKLYPPGTVLLAMIGQGKTRGQCAILDCHASTNQNVAGIHVYETPHNSDYVYWWLYSRYQESRSTETGTAQPALSGERVKAMPIPLPSAKEQRMVVQRLESFSQTFAALRSQQAETAEELNALMPSILSKAFSGEP